MSLLKNKKAIIHPIGMLKQYTSGLSDIEIDSDQTIAEVFNDLNIPSHLVALVLVNKVVTKKDYRIKQGDFIEIMAVLGGG